MAKQFEDDEKRAEEVLDLVLGRKREEQCLREQGQHDKHLSLMI